MGGATSSEVENKNNQTKKFREPSKIVKVNKQSSTKKDIEELIHYKNVQIIQQKLNYDHILKQMPHKTKEQFQEIKSQVLKDSKNIILNKILKRQIRPIFVSQKFDQSKFKDLKSLQEILQIDLQLYELVLTKRIQSYFCLQFKQKRKEENQSHQNSQNLQQMKEYISQLNRCLIGEVMGKTSIWRSLMIQNSIQREKIIEFLLKEGIKKQQIDKIVSSKSK